MIAGIIIVFIILGVALLVFLIGDRGEVGIASRASKRPIITPISNYFTQHQRGKSENDRFLSLIKNYESFKRWQINFEIGGYTVKDIFKNADPPHCWIKTPTNSRITYLPPKTILDGWNHPIHDDAWQHWTEGAILYTGNDEVKVLKRFTAPRLHFWVETTANHKPLTVFPHEGHESGHIHEKPTRSRRST